MNQLDMPTDRRPTAAERREDLNRLTRDLAAARRIERWQRRRERTTKP